MEATQDKQSGEEEKIKMDRFKTWIALGTVLAVSGVGVARAQDPPPAQKEQLYSVGVGMILAEEGVTFSRDSLFVTAKYHGLHVPDGIEKTDLASGVGINLGPRYVNDEGTAYNLNVRLYSINEVRIGDFITGMHLKIADSGKFNWDELPVVGYVLHKHAVLRVVALDDEQPLYVEISATF